MDIRLAPTEVERRSNPHAAEPQSAPLSISGTATVRRAGLEPAISCISDRRSDHLNYLRRLRKVARRPGDVGFATTGVERRSNLHQLFRKQPFYPLYYGSIVLLMRLELTFFCFGSRCVIRYATAIERRYSDSNGDTTFMVTCGLPSHCLAIRLIPAYGEYRALDVRGTSA